MAAAMMAALSTRISAPVVRCESSSSNEDCRNRNPNPFTRLSLPKPSWIVRTESFVRKEVRNKPDPPCVICGGSGRVDCHDCYGKGRTNYTHLAMLPKGEWPKWCKTCRGSGLGYCSRCLGTGEYRYIMGFQFMKRNIDDDAQECKTPKKVRANAGNQSAADLFLNEEELNTHHDTQPVSEFRSDVTK